MSTRIKFCGCTSADDARLAERTGADAIGMIFAPSPRRIDLEQAREIAASLDPRVAAVAVFANPSIEEIERVRELVPALIVQLSGEESPEFVEEVGGTVVKVIHVDAGAGDEELEAECNRYPSALVLFDTKVAGHHGGTGVPFDWSKIARIARARPVVVAGGLTPENVGDCVRGVHPAWVDVRSGIETGGRKDEEKMRRFIEAVRENDAA